MQILLHLFQTLDLFSSIALCICFFKAGNVIVDEVSENCKSIRHYRFGGEYDLTSFNLIYMRDEGEARQSIREQNITNTFKDFKIKLAKIDTFK